MTWQTQSQGMKSGFTLFALSPAQKTSQNPTGFLQRIDLLKNATARQCLQLVSCCTGNRINRDVTWWLQPVTLLALFLYLNQSHTHILNWPRMTMPTSGEYCRPERTHTKGTFRFFSGILQKTIRPQRSIKKER